MAESPATEELELLRKQQGPDALVVYAARVALRKLFKLGEFKIDNLWQKDRVMHLYHICRVHLLLRYHFSQNKITKEVFERSAKAAYTAAYAAYDAAYDAYVAPYDAAYAAYAAADIYAYAAANIASKAHTKANRTDFQFLLENDVAKHPSYWQASLWPEQPPQHITNLFDRFLTDLRDQDLGFLAEDLASLWQSQPIPKARLARYIETPSDSVLVSAESLREFILGGEIKANRAVRAMLVGPGGAGKTSLWQLLVDGKVAEKTEVTQSIVHQNHQPVNFGIHKAALSQVEDLNELNLYLWDFGGQAIFHSLHSAFMKENCVYIVVVDSRHEQAPDEWLYQIDELTGGNAKVLLVTNWFDKVNREQNKTSLLRRFSHLIVDQGFFNFSCQHRDKGFDQFVKRLVETALNSRMKILPSVLTGIDILDAHFTQQNSINKHRLHQVLAKQVDKTADVINGLNILGRIVPLQQGQFCLKPEWIIDKAYGLISANQVLAHHGVVDEPLIWEVLDSSSGSKGDSQLSAQVIGFLTDHELAIKISTNDDPIERYFLPDVATADEPDEIQSQLLQAHLTFAYELRHLPAKLKTQVVTQLHQSSEVKLNLPDDVWRDGIIVRAKNSNDLIIMEYQYRRQRLELNLVGDPAGDLPKLLNVIDKILEKISGRQLIGHMRLDKSVSDMPCSTFSGRQTIRVEDSVQQEMVDLLAKAIKASGLNLIIKQESNVNTNSNNTITDSTVAMGDNAMATSIDSHNITQGLNNEQHEAMLAAIGELIQKVIENGADGKQLSILGDAKDAVANKTAAQNQQTKPFLEKMYQAMAEVDKVASMAERANKYLGAMVKAGLRYFGLPV